MRISVLACAVVLVNIFVIGCGESSETQRDLDERIREAITRLGSTDKKEIRTAIAELNEIGGKAVPHLSSAISTSDAVAIRFNALTALIAIADHDKEAVELLVRLSKTHPDKFIRMRAGSIASQYEKTDSSTAQVGQAKLPGSATEPKRNGSEPKNLSELVEQSSHTITDLQGGDLAPEDVDREAVALKDKGLDLFLNKNQADEGIRLIKEALSIDPRLPDAYIALMTYYVYGKGDYQTALLHLKSGIQHCPTSPGIYFDLGNVYADMKMRKEAIQAFEKSLELGCENRASVFYNLANQYGGMDQKKPAVSYYKKALAEDANHFGARKNLVGTYFLLGDIESARMEANRVVENDDDPEHRAWAQEALQGMSRK